MGVKGAAVGVSSSSAHNSAEKESGEELSSCGDGELPVWGRTRPAQWPRSYECQKWGSSPLLNWAAHTKQFRTEVSSQLGYCLCQPSRVGKCQETGCGSKEIIEEHNLYQSIVAVTVIVGTLRVIQKLGDYFVLQNQTQVCGVHVCGHMLLLRTGCVTGKCRTRKMRRKLKVYWIQNKAVLEQIFQN